MPSVTSRVVVTVAYGEDVIYIMIERFHGTFTCIYSTWYFSEHRMWLMHVIIMYIVHFSMHLPPPGPPYIAAEDSVVCTQNPYYVS